MARGYTGQAQWTVWSLIIRTSCECRWEDHYPSNLSPLCFSSELPPPPPSPGVSIVVFPFAEPATPLHAPFSVRSPDSERPTRPMPSKGITIFGAPLVLKLQRMFAHCWLLGCLRVLCKVPRITCLCHRYHHSLPCLAHQWFPITLTFRGGDDFSISNGGSLSHTGPSTPLFKRWADATGPILPVCLAATREGYHIPGGRGHGCRVSGSPLSVPHPSISQQTFHCSFPVEGGNRYHTCIT